MYDLCTVSLIYAHLIFSNFVISRIKDATDDFLVKNHSVNLTKAQSNNSLAGPVRKDSINNVWREKEIGS